MLGDLFQINEMTGTMRTVYMRLKEKQSIEKNELRAQNKTGTERKSKKRRVEKECIEGIVQDKGDGETRTDEAATR